MYVGILLREETQLSCIPVVSRQQDIVVTSPKDMFINKYFSLGKEREVPSTHSVSSIFSSQSYPSLFQSNCPFSSSIEIIES